MKKVKIELQLKQDKTFASNSDDNHTEAYLVLSTGMTIDKFGAKIPYSIISDMNRKGSEDVLANGVFELFPNGTEPVYENQTLDFYWHKDITPEDLALLGERVRPPQEPLNMVFDIIGINYDENLEPFVFIRDIPQYNTLERFQNFIQAQPLPKSKYSTGNTQMIGDIFEFITPPEDA